MSTWNTLMPKTIDHKDHGKQKPTNILHVNPHIWLGYVKDAYLDDNEDTKTIKISKKVKEHVPKFIGGNGEETLICLRKRHYGLYIKHKHFNHIKMNKELSKTKLNWRTKNKDRVKHSNDNKQGQLQATKEASKELLADTMKGMWDGWHLQSLRSASWRFPHRWLETYHSGTNWVHWFHQLRWKEVYWHQTCRYEWRFVQMPCPPFLPPRRHTKGHRWTIACWVSMSPHQKAARSYCETVHQ